VLQDASGKVDHFKLRSERLVGLTNQLNEKAAHLEVIAVKTVSLKFGLLRKRVCGRFMMLGSSLEMLGAIHDV
jgi:hypothetical protein